MATSKIRNAQVKDLTLEIGKLVADFTAGNDWNISGGNNDATITGLAAGVNPNDAVNVTQLAAAIAAAVLGGLFASDVVDDLLSTDGAVPLSANQGRVLNERIDNLHDEAETCGELHTVVADDDDITLNAAPDAGTLKVYLNGVRISLGAGYTISGAVLTLVDPTSKAGDCIEVDYRVDPTP